MENKKEFLGELLMVGGAIILLVLVIMLYVSNNSLIEKINIAEYKINAYETFVLSGGSVSKIPMTSVTQQNTYKVNFYCYKTKNLVLQCYLDGFVAGNKTISVESCGKTALLNNNTYFACGLAEFEKSVERYEEIKNKK